MNRNQLSYNQQAILNFVEYYQRTNPFPPTIREIGVAVNIRSTGHIRHHLEQLVKWGFLRKSEENVSRRYFADGVWIPQTKVRQWLKTGKYRE